MSTYWYWELRFSGCRRALIRKFGHELGGIAQFSGIVWKLAVMNIVASVLARALPDVR